MPNSKNNAIGAIIRHSLTDVFHIVVCLIVPFSAIAMLYDGYTHLF